MSGVWKVYLSKAGMIVKVHAHIAGATEAVLFHHNVGHVYSGGTIFKRVTYSIQMGNTIFR